MSTTTYPPFDPLTWKQADADVHVATRDGEFAGFVEFDGTAHLVHDHQGAEVGAFPTLDDAFRALEGSQEPARRASLFPLSLPRVLRRRPRRARA
ncbi:hypothetical protein [Microbacterium hydrocarbonoxydans]|uniref:hypothetical protein n=1 Tax=Microbacterium hydrocarbonoxydans TaxID=273678 RepID=UPI0007BBD351|nr:hypothetical protein [Microbacterium hydrocarbonoxydans]GAT74297.1 hypothetical protein MHM582_2802 [Microbacterium sp. HM58-2]